MAGPDEVNVWRRIMRGPVRRWFGGINKTIILILALATTAHADYHYASHSGSDEYPYTTWETATDSVNAAVEAADPGDTVYIASGEYEGLVVMYPADSLIAIIGAGMDSTHLFTQQSHHLIYVGPKTYLKGMRLATVWPYYAVWGAASGRDVIVEECRFSGVGGGVWTAWSNVAVRSCIFENLRSEGIRELSTNLSLEVANCLFRDLPYEPINVFSRHAVITNNIVLDVCGYPAFTFLDVNYGYLYISNNAIHDVCTSGMTLYSLDDPASELNNNVVDNKSDRRYWDPGIHLVPSIDWRIFNNTITRFEAGILLGSDDTVAVHYTNLWQNDDNFWVVSGYDGIFDTTFSLLHVDPMFVDSTNFHLQAFSPLIDAGDPDILDVDGTRSDIGAYGGPGGSSYIYQDLPPRIPDSLSARVWNDTVYVDWRDNYEADFFGYTLHRDTISGFTPSPLNLIAEPESSFYSDAGAVLGETYYYRIASLDEQGNRSEYSPEIFVTVTAVWQRDGAEMPRMTLIESNYPNPFNSATTIVYAVANLGPIPAEISIEIYDIMGRKVRILVNERKEVGIHKVIWDGKGDGGEELPSGIYFATINQWGMDFMRIPKKLVILK
jgi:hypothetical protein